jgi:hypothetical protein
VSGSSDTAPEKQGESGAMGRAIFLTKIATDTGRFVLVGIACAVGMMVSHEPGSDTFILNWSTAKLVSGILGGVISASVVGIIRWRMWARSHPDALR